MLGEIWPQIMASLYGVLNNSQCDACNWLKHCNSSRTHNLSWNVAVVCIFYCSSVSSLWSFRLNVPQKSNTYWTRSMGITISLCMYVRNNSITGHCVPAKYCPLAKHRTPTQTTASSNSPSRECVAGQEWVACWRSASVVVPMPPDVPTGDLV